MEREVRGFFRHSKISGKPLSAEDFRRWPFALLRAGWPVLWRELSGVWALDIL
jgi:hypothetical protein